MRTIATAILVLSAFASAQDRDRTFFLTHTDNVQQFLEVVTTIRTITDIKQVSVDEPQKSVTVSAIPAQIAMAEWIFNELDSPAPQPLVRHEYRAPGSIDDVVGLFYVTTAPTVQDFQEVSTLVRTMTQIKRVFTYNERKALLVRGSEAQVGLAAWLVTELEPQATSSTHQYRMEDLPHDVNVVQVLRLPHIGNVQDFQKAATQIRAAANLTYIFTYNSLRAMALRGTADQITTAVRVAQQLDKP